MKPPRRMPVTLSDSRQADMQEGPHPPGPAHSLNANPEQAMQLEVAAYVKSVSAELRTMARSVKLETLAYFLDMVRIEASIQVEQRAPRVD